MSYVCVSCYMAHTSMGVAPWLESQPSVTKEECHAELLKARDHLK